jgi:hypothetical protein
MIIKRVNTKYMDKRNRIIKSNINNRERHEHNISNQLPEVILKRKKMTDAVVAAKNKTTLIIINNKNKLFFS